MAVSIGLDALVDFGDGRAYLSPLFVFRCGTTDGCCWIGSYKLIGVTGGLLSLLLFVVAVAVVVTAAVVVAAAVCNNVDSSLLLAGISFWFTVVFNSGGYQQ